MRLSRRARIKRYFWRVCRTPGYIVLGAVGLAVASPVLLVILFLLAVLLAAGLLMFGVLAALAACAAYLLHCLVGLPFWFWMIFAGFGALLIGIGLFGSLFSRGGNDDPDSGSPAKTPPPRSACTPGRGCWRDC